MLLAVGSPHSWRATRREKTASRFVMVSSSQRIRATAPRSTGAAYSRIATRARLIDRRPATGWGRVRVAADRDPVEPVATDEVRYWRPGGAVSRVRLADAVRVSLFRFVQFL